ncbi:12561_t:CDS:2 [Ambispora gerdemannii]|uniref:12561_t:CDS:1 n=1 Tax=Ambispora gerdemannii TaxID=144530 RepID=A0A9N9AFM6_9GLOM|nr:12561_t:CDS:2 [Ambispora gerdemannii]
MNRFSRRFVTFIPHDLLKDKVTLNLVQNNTLFLHKNGYKAFKNVYTRSLWTSLNVYDGGGNNAKRVSYVRHHQIRNLNQDTNAAGVWDPFPDPFQPIVEKSAETALDDDNDPKDKKSKGSQQHKQKTGVASLMSPRVMDAVLTTVMGLAAVGLGGVFYQTWYEWNEVHKVLAAFTKKSSLLKSRLGDSYFPDDNRDRINRVVAGQTRSKYYLLVGEKGTGKTQLVLNAMDKIGHYGVVFCEAHSDSEVFKARLGKALNYTYREDYVGGLFAREAPERGSALLDVERALNMVEIVAHDYLKRKGRPLVLIINNIHSFKDDEDGNDLLEILQQRAESWAASRIATVIFNTDDYAVYERMKRDASRMEVIRVTDLNTEMAVKYLKSRRKKNNHHEPEEVLRRFVKERVGGRLSFLNRLARATDLEHAVQVMEDEEYTWIVNTIGLIPDFEESEFDEQKYAAAAWKLIRAIVRSPSKTIPLNECRVITGNSRFLRQMDHDGIVVIDLQNNVKADSKILWNIFNKIVNNEDFDDLLQNVLERVEEVDKEQRTRELIWSRKNDQTVRWGPEKKTGWFF